MNFEIHCRLLEADMWVSELLVGSPLQGFTEHRKEGGRQLSGRWCRRRDCRGVGGRSQPQEQPGSAHCQPVWEPLGKACGFTTAPYSGNLPYS